MKLDTDTMHPGNQIVITISRIYKRGLTTTLGGNVSTIDDTSDIWVTPSATERGGLRSTTLFDSYGTYFWVSPSAIDKGSLGQSDIVRVRKDGTIEGRHKPSSKLPLHKAIYTCRPDIKAIIYTHPPGLAAISRAKKIPYINIIPQAKNLCGPIGYAPYTQPESKEFDDSVTDLFNNKFNTVIIENHGVLVGGSSLQDAFSKLETLEFCVRTIINGSKIGKPVYLTDKDIRLFEEQIPYFYPELSDVAYPSCEREIRESIVKIVRRACEQGLMISSYGTVSVRWRGNDFLITPTNVSRWDITREDIVQIKDEKREPGKLPSRSVWLHQEIYKRNPHVNSIILTQPPYIMAFSVTGEKFDVRTIPESWIFLQDVPNMKFGSHFMGDSRILDVISENTPAVIIENDSLLVTGDKILNTFDRLEVAEFSATSLTMSKPVGTLEPINEGQIEELRKKFLS